MAKKVFAVTNIKFGSSPNQYVAAQEEVNIQELGLSRETLLELHAAGAIEVRVVDEDLLPDSSELDNKGDGSNIAPEGEGTKKSEE